MAILRETLYTAINGIYYMIYPIVDSQHVTIAPAVRYLTLESSRAVAELKFRTSS